MEIKKFSKIHTFSIMLCFLLLSLSCNKEKTEPGMLPEMEKEVHGLINEYRINKGLDTLTWSLVVTEICREHSENMAVGKYDVSHEGFNGRANEIQNNLDANAVAENVAAGFQTAGSVVDGWLKSEGHRENIEGDYSHTGIGVVSNGEGKIYFTQMFYK